MSTMTTATSSERATGDQSAEVAALIERLEKLEFQSRDADGEICDILYGKQRPLASPPLEWCRLWSQRPTASIDAAQTLVPGGLVYLVRSHDGHGDGEGNGEHKRGFANVYERNDDGLLCPSYAATPAIALCIAALRARVAIDNARVTAPTQATTTVEA